MAEDGELLAEIGGFEGMNTAKVVAVFLLKTSGFVAVFWLSWIFIYRPVSLSHTESSVMSDVEERQQSESYSRALQRANEQLAVTESQQKRMDALITNYEQQAKRYDAVLLKWEQQTRIRK